MFSNNMTKKEGAANSQQLFKKNFKHPKSFQEKYRSNVERSSFCRTEMKMWLMLSEYLQYYLYNTIFSLPMLATETDQLFFVDILSVLNLRTALSLPNIVRKSLGL